MQLKARPSLISVQQYGSKHPDYPPLCSSHLCQWLPRTLPEIPPWARPSTSHGHDSPQGGFLTCCRPLCVAVCFLSTLSAPFLVPTTGKDRESLRSRTESPRIKFLFLAQGREEQSESLKKMETDGAFALEICAHNRCLRCHPHPNQNGPISNPCPLLARPRMPLPPPATGTTSGSWSHDWSGAECSLLSFSLE